MTTPKPKVRAIRAWAVAHTKLGFDFDDIYEFKSEAIAEKLEYWSTEKQIKVIPVLITPLTPKKKR